MKRNWLLVTCIVGTAVTGAVFILLVPSLFSSTSQSNIWVMIPLGGAAVLFAAGAVRSKGP